jgi:hypothetical protein
MGSFILENKHYYPTFWSGCNPIHEVKEWSYVRKLVRAAIRGEKIPAILLDGEVNSGSLLAGTHRCAANDILKMLGKEQYLIDYVVYDAETADECLIDAVESGDYGRIDEIWDRPHDASN